jgi:hypothetical protein
MDLFHLAWLLHLRDALHVHGCCGKIGQWLKMWEEEAMGEVLYSTEEEVTGFYMQKTETVSHQGRGCDQLLHANN